MLMPDVVNQIPAAPAEEAQRHFQAKFTFETDCADVHAAMSRGSEEFVLLDVRSPQLYEAGHVPGATSLPQGKIIESKMREWPREKLFVVYCAGPHCNGADRAALRLAQLGRPVKIMIGGITGWLDEGYTLVKGSKPLSLQEASAA
jgi:rhodanese-related sulfurtransferase